MEPVENISFVVITRNESFAVRKCLEALSKIPLRNCEVICVDSDSSDSTLDVIRSFRGAFDSFRVFQVKGRVNAAIGRNVGIRYAGKDYVFFVDGDVEIDPAFPAHALRALDNPSCGLVFGRLAEYQYQESHESILRKVEDRYHVGETRKVFYCHGVFLVKRQVVDRIGNFDESFGRNEDNEFGLRVSAKYDILAINRIMGIHHTVAYYSPYRFLTAICFRIEKYFYKLILVACFSNTRGLVYFLKNNLGLSYCILYNTVFVLAVLSQKSMLLIFMLIIILIDLLEGYYKSPTMGQVIRRFHSHYAHPWIALVSVLVHRKGTLESAIQEIE